MNAIEKGADYSELPQSFVIFICTFDAFGKERWKYTFQNVCKEDSKLILNDNTIKLFFNTKGTKGNISKEAKRILKFIESNAAEDDFTKRLAAEVQKIKENKEWKVEYMTLLMREREKYKEGEAEGIEKTTLKLLQNLMKNTQLSLEQAMIVLEIPETDQEKYADMLKE